MASHYFIGGVTFLLSVLVSFPLSAAPGGAVSQGNVPEVAAQSDLVVKGKVIDRSG